MILVILDFYLSLSAFACYLPENFVYFIWSTENHVTLKSMLLDQKLLYVTSNNLMCFFSLLKMYKPR